MMGDMKKQSPFNKELRIRWYRMVDAEGKSITDVCKIFGIPRKTFYKWYKHDLGGGLRNYRNKRSHPSLKLTNPVRALIEKEKLRTNYGPLKMKKLVKRQLSIKLSTTIIYRFYKKKGLIRKPQKRLPWYDPITEPIIPEKPGQVVQIDIKYVWEGNQRKYQRTFVDIYTGMEYAVIMDRKDDDSTIKAFEEAEKFFPFPILGMQSDNGGEFRGTFHQYLGNRGIAHYFIPKGSPQWSGAVERAHGVIDQEFYLNPLRPWKTLTEYLRYYNYERIHLGKYLNGLIPIEKYLQYQKNNQELSPLNVN